MSPPARPFFFVYKRSFFAEFSHYIIALYYNVAASRRRLLAHRLDYKTAIVVLYRAGFAP